VDGNGTGTTTGIRPSLSIDELRAATASGEIDTVLLALTDMQGRLQGKRLTASHFPESVVSDGAEACNYLLAVDVEMNTVAGY
jgi:glutamine synthetase